MNFTEAIVLAVEKVKAWIQSGGVKWDHVSDKPFVKVGGDTLTWDGNTEGLVSVDMGLGFQSYNVSDAVVSMADLANGCKITHSIFGEIALTASDITDTGAGFFFENNGYVIFVTENAVGVDLDGLMFSKQGVYLANSGAEGHISSITIPGYTGFAKEQIDPKVLPEALQFGDKETVILEEQELAYDADEGACIAQISTPIDAGDVLTVKYDGMTYKCEASNIDGSIVFGNLSFAGLETNSGEPFLGGYITGTLLIVSADETNHIVGISKVSVKKLEPQYCGGQTVFHLGDDELYLYADRELTTRVTESVLRNAAKNGSIALHAYGPVGFAVALYTNSVGFAAVSDVVYGIVACTDMSGNIKKYYTAEYTA